MQNITTTFVDPYAEWLDVRAAARPLNAYQLLDIEPGETSTAVIEEAAQHKRDLLRRSLPGAPSALWQHINAELNNAIETLLDPRKKAAYDRQLFPLGALPGAEPQGPRACVGCDEVNPPNRAFCSQCGEALLEHCARCGQKVSSRETYCGVCGANVKAALQERAENFEARLQEVEQLERDGRFDQAVVLLSTMLSTQHAQLEPLVQRAKELLSGLPARRRAVEHEVQCAAEQAEAMADAHEWEDAVARLESIPVGLRTETNSRKLSLWRAHVDETNNLLREIRTAVMAKKLEDLLPKIERLLKLKPGHPQALRLRDQLQALQQKHEAKTADALRRQAKQLLAEHQYHAAVQLLKQAPDTVRDENFQKLYEFAQETAWLANALEWSPVVDRTLFAAAQRLNKLAPSNSHAKQAVVQIQAKLNAGAPDPRLAAPLWRSTPQQVQAQFPIAWWGGFSRIGQTDKLDSSLLKQKPGCLYVACGLALQGLGLAAVATNLLPQKKAGLLNALPRLGRRRDAVSSAWGIDLGPCGWKAIRLIRQDDEVRIAAVESHEDPTVASEQKDPAATTFDLKSSLQDLCKRVNLSGERVVISLDTVHLLPRFFRLPMMEPTKLRDAVGFELRGQVPVALEELIWDYHVAPSDLTNDRGLGDQEVVAIAAKRTAVQQTLEAAEAAGLRVEAVGCEAIALHNFFQYELARPAPTQNSSAERANAQEEPMTVVVDIGRRATNFVAFSPRSLWFRSLPMGGDRFTKALVREFRLTFADAEQLKCAPWKARALHQWDEALLPVFGAFLEEVRRTRAMLGRRRIDQMIITGGGAGLHGLLRRLHHLAVERD